MKSIFKNRISAGLKAGFLFLILFAAFAAFGFKNHASEDLSCGEPTNITRSGSGSGYAAFEWTGFDGASGYSVKYVRASDSYQSPVSSTSSTSFSFSGLEGGSYIFYFRSNCGMESSGWIGIEDVVAW